MGMAGMAEQMQWTAAAAAAQAQPALAVDTPLVTGVKKAWTKNIAFVSFQSPELAQAVINMDPPIRTVAGVTVDPLEGHKTEPNSVVVFWKNGELAPETIS